MSVWKMVVSQSLVLVAASFLSADTGNVTFERDIRPILKAHCFQCHGEAEKLEARLDVRLRRLLVQGGESGPAIQPGMPKESLLVRRVTEGEMPPGDVKLTEEEIATIERWVAAGAPTARPEPDKIEPGTGVTEEDREFWSFQAIRRPKVPAIDAAIPGCDRVRNPIDAFILERLAKEQQTFASDADRRTLMIRATVDLVGLPPTPEELDAYLADTSPDAYEKWIDHLLASPHYGERWGRFWLDVAGYAESDGYSDADPPRPYAYKFRDYVIRSLNEDKPFDAFLAEQLAGDEMIRPPFKNLDAKQVEKLVATGFLRMAADGTATPAIEVEPVSNQVVADTIKIVSTSLLGLTVGCAQCHDHRYDPIPQTDYYRMRAIFEPAYDWKQWRVPSQRLVSLYTDADREKAAAVAAEAATVSAERNEKQTKFLNEALEKELEKFPEAQREPLRVAYQTPAGNRSPEQQKLLSENPSVNISAGVLYQYNAQAAEELKKYDEKIGGILAKTPIEDFIQALSEPPDHLPVTHKFHRGDHRQPKEPVEPGGLTVCSPPSQRLAIATDDPNLPTSGRRSAFAAWLTGPENPLTARVLANRVWMHHMGRGIVGTPSDFGAMGENPTHPELLDWLATELRSGGWRLKRFHKLIMTSTAYRQSSRMDSGSDFDPDNRLYGRWSLRRMDAESLRDRILATAGTLDLTMYGPSVPIQADAVGQYVVDPKANRRSVYIQVRRSQPLAFLTAFDAPVMETNCDRRAVSTVAPQALMLMNSDFVVAQAGHFAGRLRKEEGADVSRQVTRAWRQRFSVRRRRRKQNPPPLSSMNKPNT
ncbi:MAG: PSD1 and planctomycete cytochrome C domain-containing protein [Planctomycetota bacterium]